MSELIPILGTRNPDRLGDVVFVHGLDGDARKTWQPENKPERFWPNWIGEDIDGVGVWSLGYPINAFGWKGATMPLADRAVNALVVLKTDGVGMDRPVVFIAHSLGGLLVKEMLRKATDGSVPEGKLLAQNTRGVVFLSTPHSGSNLADFVAYLKFLLPNVSVDELRTQEPRLRELNTWYRNNVSRLGIHTQVYCERKPTQAGRNFFGQLVNTVVVDAASSDPGITGVTAVPMDDDHISISRPTRESTLYRRTKEFVETSLSAEGTSPPAALKSDLGTQSKAVRPQLDPPMRKNQPMDRTQFGKKDFFVSYTKADRPWATWIAWALEEAGYTTVLDVWDFQPGSNFVLEMQKAAVQAERTVAVLSAHYLAALYTQPEWAAAFAADPQGKQRKLVPVRVGKCELSGLLQPIVFVDLVGLSEGDARVALLGAFSARTKPSEPPAFPGDGAQGVPSSPTAPERAPFPGVAVGGNVIDSVLVTDSGNVVATGPLQPRVAEAAGLPLPAVERLELIRKLNGIPPQQLNMLIFTLAPPPGLVPPMPASQGNRTSSLLEWAEAPGGCGLLQVRVVLEAILNPP
ncbi:MAG: TIR domain-containing protein [Aphanocapsa lilacina HA4352-LM1]|nr:TIR domain-containing protein [Aphanocapsa lilacina HA4352-LM1]